MKKAPSLGILLLLGAFFIVPTISHATTIIYEQPSNADGLSTVGENIWFTPSANGSVSRVRLYVSSTTPFFSRAILWSSYASPYASWTGLDTINYRYSEQATYTVGSGYIDYYFNTPDPVTATTSPIAVTDAGASPPIVFVPRYSYISGTAHGGMSPLCSGGTGCPYDDLWSAGVPWLSAPKYQLLIDGQESEITITPQFSIDTFSTTTASSFCDENVPYDNTDIVSATLTYVPNGLCRVGAFLAIPNQTSLNQFTTLSATTKEKFPFSYVVTVLTTWGTLTASSTANAPTFTYSLHDLGIGSTTPLGNILPNITIFSSSTVQTYFPSSTFDAFKTLASIALVLILVGDIFFTSRNLLKK